MITINLKNKEDMNGVGRVTIKRAIICYHFSLRKRDNWTVSKGGNMGFFVVVKVHYISWSSTRKSLTNVELRVTCWKILGAPDM